MRERERERRGSEIIRSIIRFRIEKMVRLTLYNLHCVLVIVITSFTKNFMIKLRRQVVLFIFVGA